MGSRLVRAVRKAGLAGRASQPSPRHVAVAVERRLYPDVVVEEVRPRDGGGAWGGAGAVCLAPRRGPLLGERLAEEAARRVDGEDDAAAAVALVQCRSRVLV
ncbi:hypothetical protein AB1Y20_007386 [Prymnesium parvum]|uniref:Uncharacterized protein n=1 Tax=Prymnesium parvum TaxID=97485 RepID=A0AB34IUP4_PRYPA